MRSELGELAVALVATAAASGIGVTLVAVAAAVVVAVADIGEVLVGLCRAASRLAVRNMVSSSDEYESSESASELCRCSMAVVLLAAPVGIASMSRHCSRLLRLLLLLLPLPLLKLLLRLLLLLLLLLPVAVGELGHSSSRGDSRVSRSLVAERRWRDDRGALSPELARSTFSLLLLLLLR